MRLEALDEDGAQATHGAVAGSAGARGAAPYHYHIIFFPGIDVFHIYGILLCCFMKDPEADGLSFNTNAAPSAMVCIPDA